MHNRVALLIGGNQGDRHTLIKQATVLIERRIGTVAAYSRVYETAPWGFDERVPDFLNQALVVETDKTAHEALHEALDIETELGRRRPQDAARGYASRTMDIDIIFFNDDVIDEPDLTVPHPRMHLRRFVLEPLAEIMPDFVHPTLHQTVGQMLKNL